MNLFKNSMVAMAVVIPAICIERAGITPVQYAYLAVAVSCLAALIYWIYRALKRDYGRFGQKTYYYEADFDRERFRSHHLNKD